MECNNCGFKEEVEKLERYNLNAVMAVCDICGNAEDKNSISFKVFKENYSQIKQTVLELYSEVQNVPLIAELMDLSTEVVQMIVNSSEEF